MTDERIPAAPLVSLGRLLITSSACSVLSYRDVLEALRRHICGDWGELDPEDRIANNDAVKNGDRLLSAYHSKQGRKFWVITEWDRSATTVLLPEDY